MFSLALLGKQKASEWFKDEQYHVGIVNIWRPLESPVEKSPLGHIDISTLKPEDWKKIKVIYKDRVGVMRGLVHNENHKWFMINQMNPDQAQCCYRMTNLRHLRIVLGVFCYFGDF